MSLFFSTYDGPNERETFGLPGNNNNNNNNNKRAVKKYLYNIILKEIK